MLVMPVLTAIAVGVVVYLRYIDIKVVNKDGRPYVEGYDMRYDE